MTHNAAHWRTTIVTNPAVLGGKPIVRGTRVAVELIVGWVASGHTPDEIVEDYPDFTHEDIEAALAFTRFHEHHDNC